MEKNKEGTENGSSGFPHKRKWWKNPGFFVIIIEIAIAALNALPAGAMAETYYDEEYMAMESFPGEDSIRIIDGIRYIKTENTSR